MQDLTKAVREMDPDDSGAFDQVNFLIENDGRGSARFRRNGIIYMNCISNMQSSAN
jgi:hypothetical protein